MDEIYSLWRDELKPALRKAGIAILALQDLNPKQEAAAADYFHRIVYPVLTPLAVDPGRPFPAYFKFKFECGGDCDKRRRRGAVCTRESAGLTPQLVPVPAAPGELAFVWLEQLIIDNVGTLFPRWKSLKPACST